MKVLKHEIYDGMADMIEELMKPRRWFGKNVAIDRTDIHAYSNGAGKVHSDHDACWAAKSVRLK